MKIDLEQVQKMLDWVKTKLYLDSLDSNAKTRAIKRGQVCRCNFGCGIGSEMQKDRPEVIVQNDVGNNRSGNTIVLPITHDTSTLPSSDMKSIDEAIAKTIGLMGYYADISRKLNDKLSYIDRIKEERNKAQDELIIIKEELGLVGDETILDHILKMKKY